MPPSLRPLIACALTLPVLGAGPASQNGAYEATAYSVGGITAAGTWTNRHVVAADPNVLPIGSRIKVRHAGRYSGEYVVADTGAKIVGRKLDIYMPSQRECTKFGSRRVKVRVVQLGDGSKAATQQASETVKQDVNKDIAKGAVGNAATEADWKAKGAHTVKSVQAQTPPPHQ